MQYIAEDPIHVVCRNEDPPLTDGKGGIVRPGRRRLFAKFTRGTAPDFAREIGLRTFELRKMPEDGVSREQWLAFYDSVEAAAQNGWTKDEREAIEAKLATVDGVLVVARPRTPAPWPNYDTIVASKDGLTNQQVVEKIVGKVIEDGYDLAHVLAYERERERPRKSVIDALEALQPAETATLSGELFDEELIEA